MSAGLFRFDGRAPPCGCRIILLPAASRRILESFHKSRRPLGDGSQGRTGSVAKLIHSMIRVRDEARSVEFYGTAFGLSVADRLDFDGFTLIYMSNGETGFELELTVNKSRDRAYDLGDGYGHLAVSVGDLEAEHARLTDAGLAPKDIKQLDHSSGGRARFFFIEDPDGYKIEVLERSWRFG